MTLPPRRGSAEHVSRAFDPTALTTARQLRGRRKNDIAREIGLSPAAISQYELGQARPAPATLARLALALAVPVEFFALGRPRPVTPTAAHFRSLRSTTQLQRDQALAFGTIVWRLVTAVECQVELPPVALPRLDLPADPTGADITAVARDARQAVGLGAEPVPHMLRLLEAHGVVVLRLPEMSRRVDAFSHWYGERPVIFLNPVKVDRARGRFDAAHEAGHLVMHHDAEPGSRIVENQAHDFAAEFLTPAAQIAGELPTRLDWERLVTLKHRWGVSLKALVFRAHALGAFRETTYRRAMIQLAQHGDPEIADLGPREEPMLLEKSVELSARHGADLDHLALSAGLTRELADQIHAVATRRPPALTAIGPNPPAPARPAGAPAAVRFSARTAARRSAGPDEDLVDRIRRAVAADPVPREFDVCLSRCALDEDTAGLLHSELVSRGLTVHRGAALHPDRPLARQIDAAIARARCGVLLITENLVTANLVTANVTDPSRAPHELRALLAGRRRLVPVLDGTSPRDAALSADVAALSTERLGHAEIAERIAAALDPAGSTRADRRTTRRSEP